MIVTLSEFRRQAEQHGICAMSQDWDKCGSNKQRMDLALTIKGIEYIAKAISEGWGISPSEIEREFKPFLNGRYIHKDAAGYTSAIYCGEEYVAIKTTAALVVACFGEITIPKNHICELHIVKSIVSIKGEGHAKVYLYGSAINNRDAAPAVIISEQ